jgi:Ca2+-binding RTX toxin-like protein
VFAQHPTIFVGMTLRSGGARAYLWIVAAAVAAAVAVGPAPAAPVESCSYDAAARTVTAVVAEGSSATLVVSGGALHFGLVPVACGAATTTNTDSISIAGNPGTSETLKLDMRGGVFGPGATPEPNNAEIEIATALGDAADRVVVYGTEGNDYFAAGQNGFATSSDGDVDITFAPGAFSLEVHLLGGDDYFNGRGESGAGLHFLGPITATGGPGNESLLRGSSEPDQLDGGPGNDVVRGQEGDDVLLGGEGDDSLGGGGENDTMDGGPGVDQFLGSSGDDLMLAHDEEADAELNGGPGADEARVDVLDPAPVATEIVIRPAESCEYDGVSRALSLSMTPASTATLVIVGGAIWWGTVPEPCGAATTTNTDSISIRGATRTSETLIIDQRGGFFGPGATPESNTPEIEISTNLGDATDRVIIYGTEGDDFMAAGQNGVATSSDGDVDITFAPNTFNLEFHMLGGNDHVDARGTGGAGLIFLGPVVITGGEGDEPLLRGGSANDVIDGGPGDDLIDAQNGDDVLRGGDGHDKITGGGGNDTIDGGPGADTMNGNDGDDVFHAQDDEADNQISGGADSDTAYIDTGLDPAPITVETVIGDDAPPPPPPGTQCSYNESTKTVTASIASGGAATLVAVGGEIRFGGAPVNCGTATVTNTDSIVVNGVAGSSERLTIDLSGGPFAPGATAEGTGVSEVEISLLLGDAADLVTVSGSTGSDTVTVGAGGIAFTADGDADVTVSPLPATIELLGLGGDDTLNGRGGFGVGAPFPNALVADGGDGADTIDGGSGADTLRGGGAADTLSGREGGDLLEGGDGNDSLAGNGGNDELVGGSGSDALIGGDADDVLRADDDEADALLNGGPGSDTAYFDQGIDPSPVAVEVPVPA